MAQTHVRFDGLEELVKDITGMGARLTELAATAIDDTATRAAEDMRSMYPDGDTGNLRKGVKVRTGLGDGHRAFAVVTSSAPHAHLYEYGTAVRTFGNANRGQMFKASERATPLANAVVTSGISGNPAVPVVGIVASRHRKELYAQLLNMVRQETGAQVVE
jgi:hypothetical protein